MKSFIVSAPGRVCLFGEHQDYLELSVIPSAINMRTKITCRIVDGGKKDTITVNANDLGKSFELHVGDKVDREKNPDTSYFQAVVEIFKAHGHFSSLPEVTCDVTSRIPIKSGLSSSAALLVAFVKAMDVITGAGLPAEQAGLYAYQAEHDVMGIPCGMMDQLSSAIGGIIHLACTTPPKITPMSTKLDGIVVADTQIHKSTSNVHTVRVRETKDGLRHLKALVDFKLDATPFETVEPHLKELDETERKRLVAVFKDRDITVKAYQLLQQEPLDYKAIGRLLIEHQTYLRDYFEVSVEKIDAIIDNAVKHGALGGKLTGAGLGGSIVILAPGKEDQVSKAIQDAGGIPYRVRVDRGVSVDPRKYL